MAQMPPAPVPDRTAGLTSAEERALRHLDRTRANRTPTARTDNGDAVVGATAASEVALRVLRLLMADHLIETTTEADPAEYLYWMDGWKVGYSTETPPCDLASVDPDAAELLARLTSEAGR